jgi:diguanylate cyclase (GGDEF)-like protein
MLNEKISTQVTEKVSATLLDGAYNQTYTTQAASVLCSTVVFAALYNAGKSNTVLFAWFAFSISIVVIRIVTYLLYKRSAQPINVAAWKNVFTVCATLGACSWAIVSSVLFLDANDLQRVLIILMLAGVTAGAITALAAEIVSAVLFLSISLIPLLFLLVINHYNYGYNIFAAAMIAYYLYSLATALKVHVMLKNNVKLRFENMELLKEISEARIKLEISNKNLEIAATHDPLTGLANRHLFELSLTTAIQRAKRNNTLLALFYLDLDDFKTINDVYGHNIGDLVLKNIVERIKENLRVTDIVSRVGGDEFTVILENLKNINEITNIANFLCQILIHPVVINNVQYSTGASIGISIYPDDSPDEAALIRNADEAMYKIKKKTVINPRLLL